MKTLQLTLLLLISGISFASSGDSEFFSSNLPSSSDSEFFSSEENLTQLLPTDPDLDDDPMDGVPINDYTPLLILGGIAVYAFSRKKFQLK